MMYRKTPVLTHTVLLCFRDITAGEAINSSSSTHVHTEDTCRDKPGPICYFDPPPCPQWPPQQSPELSPEDTLTPEKHRWTSTPTSASLLSKPVSWPSARWAGVCEMRSCTHAHTHTLIHTASSCSLSLCYQYELQHSSRDKKVWCKKISQ